MKNSDLTRRGFLGTLTGAGIGLAVGSAPTIRSIAKSAGTPAHQTRKFQLCVFSKHLQFLDYEELAEAAAAMGFDGIDLTVRPDGHVLPENVAADLPRAVGAIRAAGLAVPMITTAITTASDPLTRTVLVTASELEIPAYRLGYISYDPSLGVAASLEALRPQIEEIAKINEEFGIRGDYQNHDGTFVGSAVWDLAILFQDLDPEWIGVQYDIRHATVEGAHTWPLGLDLLAYRIHSLVVKDFRWADSESGVRIEDTPLGGGGVNFPTFWQAIRRHGIRCPISMHFEYPMPGSTEPLAPEALRSQTMDVMQRDLAMLRKMLVQAGLS